MKLTNPTLDQIKSFFQTFQFEEGLTIKLSEGVTITDVPKMVKSHIERLEHLQDKEKKTKHKNIQYWDRLVKVYNFLEAGEMP